MAEIEALYKIPWTGPNRQKSNAPGAFIIEWPGVTIADTCETVFCPEYSEKTVEVDITGIASVTIQGGNDRDAATPKTLQDSAGNDLVFAANGIKFIQQNTQYIKPTGVTGTGSVTIRLLITTIARRQ